MSLAAFPRAVLAGACALALSMWALSATADDQPGIFTLYVNEVEQGEVHAVVRDEVDVLAPREALEAAGLRGFDAREVEVDDKTLVSLASVTPKLQFRIDEEEIALRVVAPVELLPTRVIDLGAPPGEVSYTNRPSVFFNYAPRLTVASNAPVGVGAFAEAGVSESNRLFYSGVQATQQNGVVRGLSSINLDNRERMQRITFGDTTVSAGSIGGSAVLGGITFSRDFALNPYFARFPSTRFTSSTQLPAELDVYVNGIRVRTESIQPGTFTLDNLRGLAGAGTMRYVLRDSLGRQQIASMPYYVAPSALAKGVDDFAVSAGLPRQELGVSSFAYDTPSVISYYRRGVLDGVTVGGRAEARWERVSGGPVFAVATPVGLFEVEGGASLASDERAGAAAVFAYQYFARYFNTGASLRTQSDHYANVSLRPEADRSLLQANVNMSVPIGRRVSVASQVSLDVRRDIPAFARVGGYAHASLTRDVFLIADAGLVTVGEPTASLDAFLTLMWTPENRVYGSAGARVTNGSVGANMQVSKTASFGEDWSMVGTLDVSRETRASVQHRLQTAVSNVTTYFDWRSGAASASLEPAGGIVWVKDGGFFLTRPITDSFALVRVPNVKDVRVYLSSQEVGRTDRRGYLLVPSLLSHYGSEIKIATEDVPLDYVLTEEKRIAAPPRRGAAYVEFSAERVRYYRGRLVLVSGGREEEPTYGDLAVQRGDEEIVSPIGLGGTFELEDLTEGPHDAEIRFGGKRCRFVLEATPSEEALVDLGEVRCTLP